MLTKCIKIYGYAEPFFTLLILLFIVQSSSGQQTFLSEKVFNNPTINYYPRPLWFWNDTEVTSDIVEQQILEFKDGCSYGGFGIMCFGKNFKPDYLSEDYFRVYKSALKKAKELGLKMCLYDEFGFPSGGMGANNADEINRFQQKFPDQTIKSLDKIEFDVSGSTVNKQVWDHGGEHIKIKRMQRCMKDDPWLQL